MSTNEIKSLMRSAAVSIARAEIDATDHERQWVAQELQHVDQEIAWDWCTQAEWDEWLAAARAWMRAASGLSFEAFLKQYQKSGHTVTAELPLFPLEAPANPD